MSKFLGTLSNSLRENISHVTAAAAVTSDGPEPVFDRMQVFVESGVLQFQFLCFLKFFIWYLSSLVQTVIAIVHHLNCCMQDLLVKDSE